MNHDIIGLKRGTVRVLPHQSAWDESAREIIDRLRDLLGATALDIQHVGSTAIPGIVAKPIIDIAVCIEQIEPLLVKNDTLAENGIVFRGQIPPGQWLYVINDFEHDTRTHHIHVVPKDNAAWDDYLLFRDYLTEHPDTAQAYSLLKTRLAEQYACDRKSYTASKADFISHVLSEARKAHF